MASVIWLASYPKSGNTWLRFILANLLYGKIESSAELETAIPDIHKLLCSDSMFLAALMRDVTIIKTHLLCQNNHPLLELTNKVIYIVRNPIDVIFSSYNYLQLISNASYPLSLKEYINLFLSLGGDTFYLSKGIGNWQENANYWLNSSFPLLLIQYENMLKNPLEEIKNLVNFLELKIDDSLIQSTLSHCAFENLKALEIKEIENKQEGLFYRENYIKSSEQEIRFFNHGNSYPKDELIHQIAQQIFNPFFTSFGY